METASTLTATVHERKSQRMRFGLHCGRRASRLVEAIAYGCIPVVPVALQPMRLPYDEIVDYKQFSIGVAYDDLPNVRSILGNLTLHRRPIIKQLQVRRDAVVACPCSCHSLLSSPDASATLSFRRRV